MVSVKEDAPSLERYTPSLSITSKKKDNKPSSSSVSHDSIASDNTMPSSTSRSVGDSISSSSNSAMTMDEAYRRVGHRLSQRVGGSESHSSISQASLGGHAQSAFHAPSDEDVVVRTPANDELDYDRTSKVAKKQYTDHGTHEQLVSSSNNSILKNLTCHAKDTFTEFRKSPHAGKKRVSPTFSPHRHALSALALDDEKPKGLLGEALSAKKSKCLTTPSDPVYNNGLDNAEGNLILHEGDILRIPYAQVHSLQQSQMSIFRILGLLGQGTFAQVFRVKCLETGQEVALKIVKNKPAYTRQAAVEIDVFNILSSSSKDYMVRLQCYFLHANHLCLCFELLGWNLYEVLKKRQFRGLPLGVVRSILQQVLEGVKELSQKNIVHCDLKPENILLHSDEQSIVSAGETKTTTTSPDVVVSPMTDDSTGRTSSEASFTNDAPKIKLIDFGSACFEGHAAHTYIQSRFYRSPEILVGLPYDAAIDMWSLGCVAAELFLGLPILPGVHEHDQLLRIAEMIGPLPDRMLEQGSKASKYYVKQLPSASSRPSEGKLGATAAPPRTPSPAACSTPPPATWRIKTQAEYIQSLSASEIRKKGGLQKLKKQPANRYFKRKKLADIIMLHGQCTSTEDKETLGLFAHFLMGILDPDPLKRWTAYQASMHPFLTGSDPPRRRGDGGPDKQAYDIYWAPPWDSAICRRKLLDVQRTREKQQALRKSGPRRSLEMSPENLVSLRRGDPSSPSLNRPSRAPPAVDGMTSSRSGIPQTLSRSQGDQISPPSSIGTSLSSGGRQSYQQHVYQGGGLPQHLMSGSMGSSLNINDGSGPMMNSLPQYGAPSSLTDFNSGMAAMDQRAVMSSMVLSSSMQYAEAPMVGPQSFHGDAIQMPFEGDFAYALQRPGVVPGMDLSSSFQSQASAGGLAYSPQMIPDRHHQHQRSSSFTHSSMSRRRRSSGLPSGVPLSPSNLVQSQQQHYMSSPRTLNQAPYRPSSFMGPTSIKEDSSDYNLGGSMDSSSYPARSSAGSSATSLLAQQLEDRSAGQQQMPPPPIQHPPAAAQAQSYQDMMYPSQGGLHHSSLPPGYVPSNAAMYAQNTMQPPASIDSSGGGYYYTTYVSADGIAAMSAPVNLGPGSYGSYPDQPPPMHMLHAPPSSLHPPQGHPLQQPSLNEDPSNPPPRPRYHH